MAFPEKCLGGIGRRNLWGVGVRGLPGRPGVVPGFPVRGKLREVCLPDAVDGHGEVVAEDGALGFAEPVDVVYHDDGE